MAAVLTTSGINFSDGTSLNSRYGIVPQGAIALFFQASAPTGWTINAGNNDAALRVVNGTGGGTGGTINFSSAFPAGTTPVSGSAAVSAASGSTGNTTLDINTIPNHPHGSAPGNAFPTFNITAGGGGPFLGTNPGNTEVFGTVTGSNGFNQTHSHPWSGPASFSTTIDLRCQYIDTIFCSLN